MIQHYKDLIKLYILPILIGAAVAGACAWALSVVILKTSPTYVANVTFNMQPSEEALNFNRQFRGVSQYNPATIITETHIERLLSRPIAERTLEKLLAQSGEEAPIEPSILSRAKAWLWRSWTRLNYGEFRQVDQEVQLLNDLRESLSVQSVEGSYILRLSASYKFPSVAAEIANNHAQSYIEAATEEFQAQVDSRASVIQTSIDNEEQRLATLLEKREQLRRDFNIANLGRESDLLLSSLQRLRDQSEDDLLALQLQENLILELQTRGSSASVQGEVQDLRAEVEVLQQRIQFRRDQIETQSEELANLSRLQLEFDTLGLDIDESEASLRSLRNQLLNFELGVQSSSSQIQIVSDATVPVYPSSPKVFVNTVGATIVGAMMVFLVVVLQEVFGERIRTSFDLKHHAQSRALPTLGPERKRGIRSFLSKKLRRRQLRRFAMAFGQQMSIGSGWRSNKIIVTGFVPSETLIEVRNLLADAVRQSIVLDANADPFRVNSVGPVYSIKDWDALGQGQVVVVMEPNSQTAMDVQGLLQVGDQIKREPLFVLWA